MANIGQTMFRFCGALVLGAGATLVDHPRLWRAKPVPPVTKAFAVARVLPGGVEALRITPGKRAMSVRFNDVSGLPALIGPNSRVDVLIVMDGGAEKGRVAKLFMENMRVLAIGSVAQRTEDGRPINAAVATIEVTPHEAERLTTATTQGQIQLMLRGYGAPDSANTSGLQRGRY